MLLELLLQLQQLSAINPPTVPVTQACLYQAANRFQLPVVLLQAVMAVEGGEVGKYRYNKNGTVDLGPMQINSIWLQQFTQHVSLKDILYNGCVNLHVGAWILRYQINNAAGNFWQGVGNYHSQTPWYNNKYQQKIYLVAQRLQDK